MDQETEKIIKDQLEELPIEIRNFILEPGLGEKISNVGKKNLLAPEQLKTLETETYLVMLGLVHPDNYANELKARLNIPGSKVDNLVMQMNIEVLGKILQKLKDFYGDVEPVWHENINFILSGGDLSEETTSTPMKRESGVGSSVTPLGTTKKIEDAKNRFVNNPRID